MIDFSQIALFLETFTGPKGYILVLVVLLLCGIGLPIPEDVTLFAAGLLSYYGHSDVHLMIIVSMFGVLVGDSTMFLLGAKYGHVLMDRWIFRKLLHADRLDTIQTYFQKHGNKVIFAARFMPGVRSLIFFSAGTLHLPYRLFFIYDGGAALISVPTIVYTVYYFGDQVDYAISIIKRVEHGILYTILAVIGFVILKALLKKRFVARRAKHLQTEENLNNEPENPQL